MKRGYMGVCLIIIALFFIGLHLTQAIKFSQNCKGYLKQAANASTVELAISRLDKAISYIEQNKLTSGYTSVLYKTENDNIGFWYQNIKACREELENGKNGTQLEKTNLLLKVRESLTDDSGENGTQVIIPDGISRYPNNLFWGILLIISLILLLIGGFFISDPWGW